MANAQQLALGSMLLVAAVLQGCGSGGGSGGGGGGGGGSGSDCDSEDLVCWVNKTCGSTMCHNYNITSKSVAADCVTCVTNTAVDNATRQCRKDEDTAETCMACMGRVSEFCWTNPLSIGNCLVKHCNLVAVLQDPSQCPICWFGYVEHCMHKYEDCFHPNGTVDMSEEVVV
eukprot:TRINITY_DN43974_c0_g1_i1.p1 TRINITY_DN43974_c0_g1~~TRINITY_DN43974_c0_g1_i1.p1  ORF type:complete len:172 (-),score=27.11 TRINITY_DN43974_c0_g1_i1:298-813(-)